MLVDWCYTQFCLLYYSVYLLYWYKSTYPDVRALSESEEATQLLVRRLADELYAHVC